MEGFHASKRNVYREKNTRMSSDHVTSSRPLTRSAVLSYVRVEETEAVQTNNLWFLSVGSAGKGPRRFGCFSEL